METLTLKMEQVDAEANGTFNVKAQLPMGFETRFIKKSIAEHDSFPLYLTSFTGDSPTEPIAKVSLAIVDDHTLKITGQMDDPKKRQMMFRKTWPIYDLRIEVDTVKQNEGKLNCLVLEL